MKRIVVALMLVASTAAAADRPLVYIEASETKDGSNSRDKAKQVDFGASIAAALVKKGVPVTVVTDASKSQWTVKSVSSQRETVLARRSRSWPFLGHSVVASQS